MILKSQQCFFISLLTHVGVLAAVSLQFGHAFHSFKLGDPKTETSIQSYIQVEQPQKRSKPALLESIKPDSQAVKLKLKKQSINNQKKIVKRNHGKTASAWLVMLHRKISSVQQYPMIARKMHREGRVTVQFDMLPSGQIKNLHVVKSSQYNVLDHAALMSVNRAAPFIGARKIQGNQIKTYQLDVVFKLA